MSINLNNIFNPQIGNRDNQSFQNNSSGDNTKNIKEALKQIQSLSKNQNDLGSCISTIKEITKFLSHDSELVRNVAANTLCCVIKKAVDHLSKISDPNTVKEVSQFLLKTIDKIEGGNFNLSAENKKSLRDVKEILKALDKLTTNQTGLQRDEFVPFQNNETTNNSPGNHNFTRLLNKSKSNLIGSTNYDHFVSSVGQSINNLVGKI